MIHFLVCLIEAPSEAAEKVRTAAYALENREAIRRSKAWGAVSDHHASPQEASNQWKWKDDTTEYHKAGFHSWQIPIAHWPTIVNVATAPLEVDEAAVVAQFASDLQAFVCVVRVIVVY